MFIVFLRTNFDDVYRDSFSYHYNQIKCPIYQCLNIGNVKNNKQRCCKHGDLQRKGGVDEDSFVCLKIRVFG